MLDPLRSPLVRGTLLALAPPLLAGAAAAQVPSAPPPSAGPASTESLTVFEGVAGARGAIAVYDRATGAFLAAPPRLRDLRLVDLDHVGRTQLHALEATSPRRRADLPGGLGRLELPFGGGALYKYERTAPAGATRWGFLLVSADGRPAVVLERRGVGTLFDDPFVARIGVGPAGRGLLVATTPDAGGDLLEVDLVAGEVTNRTDGVGPRAFSDASLWLGRDWGFGVAADGVWRFARAPGATADLAPVLGPQPAHWTGEAVMSRGRGFGLTTAGAGPAQLLPYVLGPRGALVPADSTPAPITGAGHLPEAVHGPHLAVSNDGRSAGWRVDLGVSREVRTGRVDVAGSVYEVSGDAYLLDTLEEVGRMTFFRVDELTFAAGEPNDPAEGGLESADIFGARVDSAGGLTMRNVSLTMGDSTVPFRDGIPTLQPSYLAFARPDQLVMHDGELESLETLDLAAGTLTTHLVDVKEVFWAEPAGDSMLFSVVPRSGTRPKRLVRVPLAPGAPTASIVLERSPTTVFAAPTRAVDGRVSCLEQDGGLEFLLRVESDTGTVQQWSAIPASFTAPLGVLPSGDVLFSRQSGFGADELRVWSASGAADVVLMRGPTPGHPLP